MKYRWITTSTLLIVVYNDIRGVPLGYGICPSGFNFLAVSKSVLNEERISLREGASEGIPGAVGTTPTAARLSMHKSKPCTNPTDQIDQIPI